MSFTIASDQEERLSLRIGGEKYHVPCSPGRVRCNNNHVMEGATIYHTLGGRGLPYVGYTGMCHRPGSIFHFQKSRTGPKF